MHRDMFWTSPHPQRVFLPVDLPRLASVHVVRSALWLFVGVLLKTSGFSARMEIESQPAISAEAMRARHKSDAPVGMG
jgi:hypothetical protein